MIDVSEKSKKNEIFDAYQSLLKKIQETKKESHQEVQVKQHNENIVVKAAKFDTEQIVVTLSQAKLMITQNLSLLEKKLIEEYNRLNELQEAIKFESKNLEELHQIKKNADSLAALLCAQKEHKVSFETELEERKKAFELESDTKRAEWKLEKERHDQAKLEYETTNKKDRIRNEEEYAYKTTLERKKDHDAYEIRKQGLERDLIERKEIFEKSCSARQAILDASENELVLLRSRVAMFPKELNDAVDTAKEAISKSLEQEHRYTTNLKSMEVEGERKLQQQTINSLQAKIKEQDALMKELSTRTEDASKQVQSIAIKALEGAAGMVRNEREDNKTITRQ